MFLLDSSDENESKGERKEASDVSEASIEK